ncbi:MAG: PleD family two-component response regulator [Paraglaciecola sp.]|jgi:PleD family two-component response regulator
MFKVKSYTLFEGQLTYPITIRHLKKLSQIVSTVLSRPTDILTRYNDKEFAILLPDTSIFVTKYTIQKILTWVAGFKSRNSLTF